MSKYLFIFHCLFWICFAPATELTPYATHWDSTKGLTHNSVYDIEEDSFGRLWLATPGGVSIVDGLGVIQLKKSHQKGQGIHFNPVTQIHAHKSKMWVLGLGGIELVDSKSLKSTPFPDPHNQLQRVTSIVFINDQLAYSIANRQLIKIDLTNNTLSIEANALYKNAQVNSFARYDADHILLMTSSGMVLFNWKTGKHRLFNLENLSRGKEDIRALWVDPTHQNVWLSIFNKGIYVYDKQNRLKAHLHEQAKTLPSNMVANFQVKKNEVYAVTKHGVVMIDRITAIPKARIYPTSINDNYRQANMALSAKISDSNELFIGTTNGFYYISPIAYAFRSLTEAIPNFKPPILTQFVDNNELVIMTPTEQYRYAAKTGLRSQKQSSNLQGLRFFANQANAVKNFSEVALFDDQQYIMYPVFGRPDPDAPITYSVHIKEIDLFVLFDDKYMHIAQKNEQTLQTLQSFPLELASVVDSAYTNGQLYISSQRHGVMTLALDQLLQGHTVTLNSLSGAQAVTSLFLDSNLQLWISTLDEGIYTLDTTQQNNLMKPLALTNADYTPSASCIIEDRANNIWISSRHGVSVFDQSRRTIHSYTGANGLGAIPITDYCGRIGEYIYFSNSDALLLINPDKLAGHQPITSLSFTDFSIDGRSTPVNDNISITDPSVIEFALSTALPPADSDQLMYRLQGTHSERSQWLPSRSRYITLIKPKPGQYIIQAKLLGYDGVQKAYVESHFQVQAPLYLRPLMIALYIAIAFIIIAVVFVFKLRLKNAELAISKLKHKQQASYAQDLAQQVAAKTELYKEQQQIAVKANLDKTRFIASASHDLRAPLNAIRLKLLDLLPQSNPSSGEILNEITLLDQLVDSIVSLSKFDAKMVKPALSNVDINSLITQSTQRFLDMAQQKKQCIRFTPHINEAWVYSDPFLLSRVINNLIDNAIKNTPENGLIDITIELQDRHYHLAIKDTGKGIDDELKEKIFNSFVRGTESYAGSGLGLTIVQQICTILALPIHLNSSLSGSIFTLKLAQSTQQKALCETSKTAKTVLIIDDDHAYANDIATMVKRRGLDPKIALSTADALSYTGPTPELIISDYHLDNGAIGTDIASQLAERFSLTQSNIVIMSEDFRIRDQIKVNFGYLFLNKPVKYSRLSWLIQQLGDNSNYE